MAQAKQYFACDYDHFEHWSSSGDLLYLVNNVAIEMGRARPFNIVTDTFPNAKDNHISTRDPVYPIKGSFTSWQCRALGGIYQAGKNCAKLDQPNATGICYKSQSGDWHCMMTGSALGSQQVNGFPPPGK